MSHVGITSYYCPGEISFLQDRACKPRPHDSREEHLELKVFPSHTEKVYCIAATATDAYLCDRMTFLAPTTGKTANVSQLTMRLPCDPTLPFCCYKARYFTGPSMGGMRGFTNSLSLRWSLLMRRH